MKKLSRRDFLRVSAISGAGFVIAACSQATPTAPPAGTQPPGAATATGAAPAATSAGAKSARGFIEPPFLADRVASGKLPPIDQRLPDETFVVGPGVLLDPQYGPWQNGQYGGEIDIAPTFGSGFLNIAQSSTILRSPSQSTKASKPNVVSAFSNSADYTNYKFTLRKGLKWSDGQPVTTEDIRFVFEDLYQDKDVQRPWPAELLTQGNGALGPAVLKIVDDYNFELTFSQPYGNFIAALNSWIPSYDILMTPAHYVKQFHAKYAKPDELAALLKKANETSWVKLLNSKDTAHWDCGELRSLGKPVLNAYVLTQATDTRRVFERNPFFWHVDSDGRQLPYIDTVVNNISIDDKAQLNAVMAGKVNLVGGNTIALSDMPVIVGNAAKFSKRVFTTGSFNNPILLFLNHDYEYDKANSVWQKLISDPDHRFGQAIAASMDPNEVNSSVYFGKYGKPFANATGPDLAKANSLLDALGLDKKGPDGLRLGTDGQPFIFRITNSNQATDFTPVAELLKAQIQKSGLHVEIEVVDANLWGQRLTANQISASIHWNDGPGWVGGISEDYLPEHKGPWSPLTYLYFTSNGKQGRKPPAYIQQFYDLYTAHKQYPPESDKGAAIFKQMLDWMYGNYVMIPTVGPQVKPALVDAKLQNVPNDGSPFDLDVYINVEGYWFANA